MKKKGIKFAFVAILTALSMGLAGCSLLPEHVGILSIEKTATDGLVDTYTIYYTDGTQTTFTVTNGEDGKNGKNGVDGKDGEDGEDANVSALYQKYVEIYGNITYAEFLDLYLAFGEAGYTAINRTLRSTAKVFCEFTEPDASENAANETKLAIYTGAAVVYQMDGENTYFLTNYHVVHSEDAVGEKISQKIHCYLYGSESVPQKQKDENGNTYAEYDSYAIACEYIGGAATYDLALLRADTKDVLALNPDVCAVDVADEYYVGQTAITVGNPGGDGLSVTQGVVSVANEFISLSIDGTSRSYRSIRMDTPLYKGNSGGGLFNEQGELIGISNAGDTTNQNINYAIPLQIVKAVTENIFLHHKDGDENTVGVYKPTIGVTVQGENTKYVYDEASGFGNIVENVVIKEITEGSIAQTLGLKAGDVLCGIVIDGETYTLERYFSLGDYVLGLTDGVAFRFLYEREGVSAQTAEYTVLESDLNQVA